MLVLDSSFTKEDVAAIDHFVNIAIQKERKRIANMVECQGIIADVDLVLDFIWNGNRQGIESDPN